MTYKEIQITKNVFGCYEIYDELKNKFEVFDTTKDCKNYIDEYLTV